MQDRFATGITPIPIEPVPPNTPVPILSLNITPTTGNKLLYTAYVAFELGEISTITFRINDTVGGPLVVQGVQSYPSILPLLIVFDTIALQWEIAGVAGGPHTVTLEMETTGAVLIAGFRSLRVEELVP